MAPDERKSPHSFAGRSDEELKKAAAWKACEFIKSDQVVGLGTGSTAVFAVERIAQLIKQGKLKNIVGIPTSTRTYAQAKALGITLSTLDEHPHIHVAIDGADEVDPKLNLVKGRGGALLREKMVEMAADKFICIVDESKLVEGLGGSQLAMPIEIVQFCHLYTMQRLAKLPELAGCEVKLRCSDDAKTVPYVTDNANYIADLYFKPGEILTNPGEASKAILSLEGVVEHGLFLDMADVVIIAGKNGVEVKEREGIQLDRLTEVTRRLSGAGATVKAK